MDDRVIHYFARPIVSVDVALAKDDLKNICRLDEENALDVIKRLNTPCYIGVFPNTYCVKIENGTVSSTLVSTYGDDSTLKLLSRMRKLNPESFK